MGNETATDYSRLERSAAAMRKDILEMGLAAAKSEIHLGGSLSCVEILAALYLNVMRYKTSCPCDEESDIFIFSKGHGAPALYAAMHQVGLVADDEIKTFKQPGSFLTGHPSRNVERGIVFSSGSLGQGLSLGIGSCLAARHFGYENRRVYVLLGDGECDEGSIWEAAMCAAHYGLSNLIAIVDANGLQYDESTYETMTLGNQVLKWESFGWDAVMVNGHDFSELIPALEASSEKPRVIIAKTVKGKGVSFAEGVASWHSAQLTQKLYDQAMAEIEEY